MVYPFMENCNPEYKNNSHTAWCKLNNLLAIKIVVTLVVAALHECFKITRIGPPNRKSSSFVPKSFKNNSFKMVQLKILVFQALQQRVCLKMILLRRIHVILCLPPKISHLFMSHFYCVLILTKKRHSVPIKWFLHSETSKLL